jgi:hypothetical protein
MRLTSPTGKLPRSRTSTPATSRSLTTAPGFRNTNHQQVIERTGFPSTTFPGQTIYRLKCQACTHEYGSNGTDIHTRRCPKCQNGTPGEPLRDKQPSLFG